MNTNAYFTFMIQDRGLGLDDIRYTSPARDSPSHQGVSLEPEDLIRYYDLCQRKMGGLQCYHD